MADVEYRNGALCLDKLEIDGNSIENIQDKESRIEIKTDVDGKIISYRDGKGMLHEAAGIEASKIKTNSIILTPDGMNDFQMALRESGFSGGAGDWSSYISDDGDNPLHLHIPRCAMINIIGDRLPTSKTDDFIVDFCFYDMEGNYFKKKVIINAQGRSSLGMPKKNFAIDLFDEEVDGDAFAIRFGDWVPQDSFHLKAYYTDPFRGLGAIGYELYDNIVRTRGIIEDYPWKKALINHSSITATTIGTTTTEEALSQMTSGARCFPKGFPCIVYHNGEFYGIYSLQLKKSRDNYVLNKKKATNIHLDGIMNMSTLLGANGDASAITWTTENPEGFEVRNPKDLYMMNGAKYDADNNGGELIDSTSEHYDSTNKDHVKTAQVKQFILDLSSVCSIMDDAAAVYEASEKTPSDLETLKSVIETYWDIDNVVDYIIFGDIVYNWDGFWGNNWQLFTYDGVKWWIGLYDIDSIFGHSFQAGQVNWMAPQTQHLGLDFAIFKYVYMYYSDVLNERYSILRHSGILTSEYIVSIFENWINAVGKDIYKKEYNKWPDGTTTDSIFRIQKWIKKCISNMDILYNYQNS